MGQTQNRAGVVVWGSSECGQLGVGGGPMEDGRPVQPKLVESLRSFSIRSVQCGGHHSTCLSESGEVWSFGRGASGELGHGDLKDQYFPKQIRALQSKVIKVISCGEHHTACVSESGVVYTWGRGQNGRLGHGSTENEILPKAVESLVGQHVTNVSCGDFHTMASTSNPQQVYSWGLGLSGRLGLGDEEERHTPCPIVDQGALVTQVACGGHHSAYILEHSGLLMTFGGGAFGKLGHGTRLAQLVPKEVQAFANEKVVQIALGPHHSCALLSKGRVYTWGQAGRLGHSSQGAEVDEMVPRQVMALQGVFVVQVSCGHSHCAVVTETGDVWAWGSNRAYGHTDLLAVPNQPTLIKMLAGKAIVQVSCGISHTIALSDYKRLSGKAALAAARSMELPVEKIDEEDEDGKPKVFTGNATESTEPLQLPGPDKQLAFLSQELKSYQELTLTLAKELQDSQNRLVLLTNENSFLKRELEVMHQCTPSADDRLDTLRRHFSDRLRDMERRHAERENKWKITLAKYRTQVHTEDDIQEEEEVPTVRR